MLRFSALAFALLSLFAAPAAAVTYTPLDNLEGVEVNIVYYSAPGVIYTGPGTPTVYNDDLGQGGFIVNFFGDGSPYTPLAHYTVHNKPGAFLTITPVQFSIEFQNVAYPPAIWDGAEIQISAGQVGLPQFVSINYLGTEGSNVNPPPPPIVTLVNTPTGPYIKINVQNDHFTSFAQYTWGFTAEIQGDPQFTGFMGQSYQVHGTSGSIYNIMSTPSFQYNALFSYLSSGRARKGTQAFSHPGNYFGRVSAQIKDSTGLVNQLLIQSGAVDAGLTLQINNQTLTASDHVFEIGAYKVSVPNQFEVVLESDEFNVRVQNSDFFLNQDVYIGSGLMRQLAEYKQAARVGAANAEELKAALPHGILGQTWNAATYNNRWKHIEGHLFDYQLADGVFGKEFKYNKF